MKPYILHIVTNNDPRKLWKKDSADYTLPEIQFCSPIPLNYFTNSTFDWAGFLHYSNTSFVTGNNSINMPGYFQPWNGELLGKFSVKFLSLFSMLTCFFRQVVAKWYLLKRSMFRLPSSDQ